MTDVTTPWILAGYAAFAKAGPSGLKVEALAREVGKSKSSFYHHFADMEVFTSMLLEYHLQRAAIIAEREAACARVVPDLLEVLVEFGEDLLFNRQLRVYRHEKVFRDCIDQVNMMVAGSITAIWAEELGIPGEERLAELVLRLTMDNFFLQITPETLNVPWLEAYFGEMRGMVMQFQVRAG